MVVAAAASRGEEHVDALGGVAQLVDARNRVRGLPLLLRRK